MGETTTTATTKATKIYKQIIKRSILDIFIGYDKINGKKNKLCLFKKAAFGSFRQGITMGKCKTKAIQADVGIFTYIPAHSTIFRHIQAYSSTFRNYSGIVRLIQNPVQLLHI